MRSFNGLAFAVAAFLTLATTASGSDLVCWNDGQCQPILEGPTPQTRPQQIPVKKWAPPSGHAAKASPTLKVSAASTPRAKPDLHPLPRKVAIQVNERDKQTMDLALNNAKNIVDYYKASGEPVLVEIVAYGPGLHMLRADTSPVKERIAPMALENPSITFYACGNTQVNQGKAEGKPVELLSEAKVTPSGVVRLMELQKQGYAYIRP